MKQLLSIFLILISIITVHAGEDDVRDDLKAIDPFLGTDLDSAYILSKALLEKSEKSNNHFGMVKSNLYLGYIAYELNDYGKSVIYYLEGIRRSGEADYEGLIIDQIWLRRNLANTFRNFEANSLATKYNLEAIDLAIESENTNQIVSLHLNQALVYQNNKEYDLAINHLHEIIPLITDEGFRSEILNQIGIVYHKKGSNDLAIKYYNKVLEINDQSDRVKLFTAKALHNIGEIEHEIGNLQESIEYLNQAIELMESITNTEKYGLFISYRNLGQYLFESGNIDRAEIYLFKALDIASFAEWDASSFNVYKILSDLYYKENNNNLGSKYSNLYFNKIQEYLETQEDIQKKDKEYNFDLITKRYFDEVEKQERIASIMFWSKLTSGGLLTVLLLVIAFNRYEKLRLRKTIEQELISLKIID